MVGMCALRSAQDDQPSDTPGEDSIQAEAIDAYARSMLEPLVARMAELERTIRAQAETIGELRGTVAAHEAAISSLTPRTAPQPAEATLKPAPTARPLPVLTPSVLAPSSG